MEHSTGRRIDRQESAPDHSGPEERRAAGARLEGEIAFQLRLAQNASFRAFQRRTGQTDLRPGWYAVLSLIGDKPGIAPMALARGSGRDKSTLTPMLRDMIEGGFVERRPKAGDRRSYGLRLTETGRARLDELATHAVRHDARLDAIVGQDKARLVELLKRITAEIG